MTLLEFLFKLIGHDPASLELQQDFRQDPVGTLDKAGLTGLTANDVHDALVLIQDNSSVDNSTVSFDRTYDTGGNHIATLLSPPPAPHHEAAHDGGSAAEYLTRYVTNTEVTSGGTIEDHSTNQDVRTGGGDFTQSVVNHSSTASGDGAVSAGDGIANSTIIPGSHNVIGNTNVTGDSNTTAFGAGNASGTHVGGDLTTGAGSAFSTAGPVTVDNSDHSTHTWTSTKVDSSVHDSNNNSSDNSVHDSHNTDLHYDTSSHDTVTTNVDASQHDVGNHDLTVQL